MRRGLKNYWKGFVPQSWHSLKEYNFSFFKKDLFSGVTVGIVALPLAMAFAIASGVAPERGLYTAIVAGFLISLLGGSRVQIGGPTGAFVVIVFSIVQRQGYEGLLLATIMASAMLAIMAFSRLGNWIKFIPYPLTVGFTSGIAVIIFSSQIKDFFGLKVMVEPAEFMEKWHAFYEARHTWDLSTFYVALSTLLLIVVIKKFTPKIPWGIVSIAVVTVACSLLHIPTETVKDRFGDIPGRLPLPSLPELHFSLSQLHTLFPDALTIALLAAIESLLSAVVADGMTGWRHRSNAELLGQSFANLGSVFFGGIPATGAIARTATNVKTGAMTPLAGIIHAATLFLIVVLFAPYVSQIPLAALSAVLVMVAWNMSELHHFLHIFKAPPGDVAVLLSSFLLTVFIDLTVAVEVGMVLAAMLFMKRMGDISNAISRTPLLQTEEEVDNDDPDAIFTRHVPPSAEVYEINGPFFFGVADSLKSVLENLERDPKVFILRLRKVPVIDATGLHALKEFYMRCRKRKTTLLLSGLQAKPARSLKKYGLEKLIGEENIFSRIDPALRRAAELVKSSENGSR